MPAPSDLTERLLVTVATTAPIAEKIVYAATFGSIWLSNEPLTADESGTQVVDGDAGVQVSRVLVATTSDEFARRVRLAVGADNVRVLLAAPVGSAAGDRPPDRSADPMPSSSRDGGELPDVLVFGPGVPTETAFAVAAFLDERHPGTSVVLATGVGPDEWLAAMRVGIRDVVAPGRRRGDLRVVLERAAVAATARRRAASPTAARAAAWAGHPGRLSQGRVRKDHRGDQSGRRAGPAGAEADGDRRPRSAVRRRGDRFATHSRTRPGRRTVGAGIWTQWRSRPS